MYAILDIETTGGKFNEEGITEIAIHKFNGHEVVDKFISLVNPEKEIQPFVVNLTGINNKMLRTAPKFHEVAKRIVEVTQDAILVAHNAQFDYRILRTEFRRLGYNFERKTLCTVDLSKKLIPNAESHSLGKLVRSLGIPVSDRHRANGDALATLKLFKLLLAKDSDKSIIKDVIRKESQGELSPRQLDIVKEMPSETGIFYMHNKDGDVIFLAKSNDIKKRVNQKFTKNGPRDRKLQKETKKVTYEKTGSELVALLKENEELLRNKPKYGRKANHRLFSHVVYLITDETGRQALKVGPPKEASRVLTTFSSIQSAAGFIAKVTEEFGLNPRLNGVTKSHLDSNSSIKENTLVASTDYGNVQEYNDKITQLVDKYSLGKKNLLVVDKGREIGEYSAILIKNGIFQGVGYYDLNYQINNIHILESIITPMRANANAKHIIESYLRKRRVLKVIALDI